MPSTITDPGTSLFWVSNATTSLSAITVVPTVVGDAMVLWCLTNGTTNNISTVSGGGCPNSGSGTAGAWARVMGPTNLSANGSERAEMWLGRVATTGSSTLTLAWTTSISTTGRTFGVKQFSAGGIGTVWTADGTGGISNNTGTPTNVVFPSLTPTGANRCYIGFAYVANTGTGSGQTAGYTEILDGNSNIVLYNPNVANSVQSPTAVQSPVNTSDVCAVLVTANNRPTAQFTPFFM